MTKNVILLAKQSSDPLYGYYNAKPIRIPFIDNLFKEISKAFIIFGLEAVILILLYKYLQSKFENFSRDEEKDKKILWGGVTLIILGIFIFGFIKLS